MGILLSYQRQCFLNSDEDLINQVDMLLTGVLCLDETRKIIREAIEGFIPTLWGELEKNQHGPHIPYIH